MTSFFGSKPASGIDYRRLYEFRFRHVSPSSRAGVWREIADTVHEWMGRPQCVLDVAAGSGEFINAITARERWAVDVVDFLDETPDVTKIIGDIREIELPEARFDGVFVSNFLEHLVDAEEVGAVLQRLRRSMAPGGRIAVLGPNFRHCSKAYFDCADHRVVLTHLSVEEHLYAAGYSIDRVVSQFLPFSFRGILPTHPLLVRTYMRVPAAWRVLGKQYLVLATNPAER